MTWKRSRHEFGRRVLEQMYTTSKGTKLDVQKVFACLHGQLPAQLCKKEQKPLVRPNFELPNGAHNVAYWSDYRELLPWRFRISCLLQKLPDQEGVAVVAHTADDKNLLPEQSLNVTYVRHHPFQELPVLQSASHGILKSKGPEHFERFRTACLIDPTSLLVARKNADPYRVFRREIRRSVNDLLSDTYIQRAVAGI